MLNFEEEYYKEGYTFIAGTDEAGRGPLAGPLVVAAVILDKSFNSELINDSKKLTSKRRDEAYDLIIENALAYSIEIIDVKTIDDINIYEASRLGMIKCFNNLKIKPDLYLTDAMPIKTIENCRVIDIIKGDSKSKNIAAASILAKVTRDRIMIVLDKKYPMYEFKKHKGYGTKIHIEAINKYGVIKDIHRLSYTPCKNKPFFR